MTKLKPLKNDLEELLSKMSIKARARPEYTSTTAELDKMYQALSEFIWNSVLYLADVESVKEETDDHIVQEYISKLKNFIQNADHHLAGAKGAKTKYCGLLKD